jgi:hypothetical protein
MPREGADSFPQWVSSVRFGIDGGYCQFVRFRGGARKILAAERAVLKLTDHSA